MDAIPQAALGTLWIGSSDLANPIEQVLSYKEETREEAIAVDFAGILLANVGKNVTISYDSNGKAEPRIIKGSIISTPIMEKSEIIANDPNSDTNLRYNQPDRYGSSGYYNPYDSAPRYRNIGNTQISTLPQIVTIKTEDGLTALNINQISDITINDPNPNQNYKKSNNKPAAKLKLKNNTKTAEISTSYLIKGITWSPSYILDIQNTNKAKITMDAVLATDALDLEDAEVSFAVGFPNFLYSNITNPMYVEQSVNDFVKKLMNAPDSAFAPRLIAGPMSQLASNNASYNTDNSNTGSQSIDKPANGESNEDLYFYTQSHVTMPKGSRARYNVFNDEVNYKHIYELELQDLKVNNRYDYYSSYSYYEESLRNPTPNAQIWHSIRILNNTNKPFTTAPILVMNGTKPVSQDVLKYTPPGATNIVKLTVATDIKAEQISNEVSRDEISVVNSTHVRVTMNGNISIKNSKKTSATILVTKKIYGEVVLADNEGKISSKTDQLSMLNLNSRIEWEFELGAGESKNLNFKYKTIL